MHFKLVVAHQEQWWLIGSSDGSLEVVVAHWQWHKTINLHCRGLIRQSPQPKVDFQSLDGLPSGTVLNCNLSQGQQRRVNTKKGFWSTKNNSREKKKFTFMLLEAMLSYSCSKFRGSYMSPRLPGLGLNLYSYVYFTIMYCMCISLQHVESSLNSLPRHNT